MRGMGTVITKIVTVEDRRRETFDGRGKRVPRKGGQKISNSWFRSRDFRVSCDYMSPARFRCVKLLCLYHSTTHLRKSQLAKHQCTPTSILAHDNSGSRPPRCISRDASMSRKVHINSMAGVLPLGIDISRRFRGRLQDGKSS